MLFKKDLIPKILSGEKTQTRRVHKHKLKVGKVYPIQLTWFTVTERKLRITGVREELLGAITNTDARKEGFSSRREFKEKWIEINKKWDPDLLVTVYDFELLPIA